MIIKRVKKSGIILGIILLSLSAIILLLYLFLYPYRGSVKSWAPIHVPLEQTFTKEEAIEDLSYLLKRYHSVDYLFKDGIPPAFQQQFDKECKSLSNHPSTVQIWQAASRITNTLKNAHDSVYAILSEDNYFYVFYKINNGTLYLYDKKNQYRVKDINGTPADDIISNATKLFSYENDYYLNYKITAYLQSKSGVAFLTGKDNADYVVTYLKDNKVEKKVVEVFKFTNSDNNSSDFVKYTIDPDYKVAILTLTQCNYNDHYKKVLKDFFTEVKDKNIENVAVDLRTNGGGNSMVAYEFLKYLNVNKVKDFTSYYRLKKIDGKSPFNSVKGNKKKDLVFNGNVYVLTSTKTFSSAMQFSVLLQDNKLAKVIGEPCGNKPSQYGETVTFTLPHSKLFFDCSISYFVRPDKKLKDDAYQVPDYEVGEDQAVAKLYDIIDK